MVQFGYWFRFGYWSHLSAHITSKMWWLMVQSAYWFNIWLVSIKRIGLCYKMAPKIMAYFTITIKRGTADRHRGHGVGNLQRGDAAQQLDPRPPRRCPPGLILMIQSSEFEVLRLSSSSNLLNLFTFVQ